MDAGPIKYCRSTGCRYYPSAQWRTKASGTQRFIDTSIRLNSGERYPYGVDYVGNGSWQAAIAVSGLLGVTSS